MVITVSVLLAHSVQNVKLANYQENGTLIPILVFVQHQQMSGMEMLVSVQQEHSVQIVLLVQLQDNGLIIIVHVLLP